MQRVVTILAAVSFCIQTASAQPTCQDKAAERKLAGAALSSFMTKCEKDAAAACQKTSAGRKLAGAAKTSFETKCVNDAVGRKS